MVLPEFHDAELPYRISFVSAGQEKEPVKGFGTLSAGFLQVTNPPPKV